MNVQEKFTGWFRRSGWIIGLIALLQFVLHLWVAAHDDFFRDELYYIAASRHLGFGFVDFPPFVAVAVAVSRAVLGGSVLALRVLPAIAGVIVVLVTAWMVAELGGGRISQVLAALAIAFGPVFIGSSGLMTMDPFDILWWTLCAATLLLMIRRQEPRLWLLFGLFAGLGLFTKLTMGFYAGALVAGLLLSSERKLLFSRWLIAGGAIALVCVSPYILWNIAHGWPTIEFTRAYGSGKTFQANPLQFLGEQVVQINPFAWPIWLGGLYWLFFTKSGRPYRAFGWAYAFLYVFFMIEKAKFYWLAPAYPALLASGATALELLVQERPRLRWLPPAAAWTVAMTGLLLVPFAIPILPLQAYLQYNAFLGGVGNRTKSESLDSGVLPQSYADRYGWKEMVQDVKAAYDTLSPEEKAGACVFASNYGEAGAVDLYGPALGLPKAISGNNSYFIWGPQGCTGTVLITVGVNPADLKAAFQSVEQVGVTHCQYCMPFENDAPIAIARGLKAELGTAWAGTKDFR